MWSMVCHLRFISVQLLSGFPCEPSSTLMLFWVYHEPVSSTGTLLLHWVAGWRWERNSLSFVSRYYSWFIACVRRAPPGATARGSSETAAAWLRMVVGVFLNRLDSLGRIRQHSDVSTAWRSQQKSSVNLELHLLKHFVLFKCLWQKSTRPLCSSSQLEQLVILFCQ